MLSTLRVNLKINNPRNYPFRNSRLSQLDGSKPTKNLAVRKDPQTTTSPNYVAKNTTTCKNNYKTQASVSSQTAVQHKGLSRTIRTSSWSPPSWWKLKTERMRDICLQHPQAQTHRPVWKLRQQVTNPRESRSVLEEAESVWCGGGTA